MDYLVQPFLAGVNSAPILGRLVNMQFARKESGRYYLHPVDLRYALSRIERGNEFDHRFDALPFTQLALWHRAADYFQQTRSPRETWKKLDDLAPQLSEFELRCAAHDFDTAAAVLLEIDSDYLLLWGHLRVMAELHERLLGKLEDTELENGSLGNLGIAYYQLGRIPDGIVCCKKALILSRERDDRQGESASLHTLAACYSALGQTSGAIGLVERALAIALEIGDRSGEGTCLGSLGVCYSTLGQTARAIELHERELVIANEIGDSSGKLHAIAHLAHCYANQGDDVTAMDLQKQAIAMAQEIRHRSGEGYEFASLADLLSQRGFYQAAIDQALAAVKINEELQSPRLGSYSGGSLARAHLLAGALSEARTAAEAARLCDAPENNYYVRALGGVIALRQGDRAAAAQMLAAAMTDASRILEENSYNYEALDSKALALCGLALCGETGRAADAMDSYRAARKINGDAGVVKRVLQLFDALAVLDTGGVLARVRATAAGEA